MVRSTRQAEPERQGRHHHQQQQGPQDHRGGRARQDIFFVGYLYFAPEGRRPVVCRFDRYIDHQHADF